MSSLRRYRAWWLAALLLLSIAGGDEAASQVNTIRVQIDRQMQQNVVIGVFRTRGILYASLTDLARTFRLVTYENHRTAKMELKQGPYRIKVTGGSPFIVVTDQSQRQTVYQLPAQVLFAAGSFFVPLQTFLPYFGLVFNTSATYDPVNHVLSVTTSPVVSTFDISSVSLEPKANGMLIRVHSARRVEDMESWLRQDGWLYLTLADVRADVKTINALKGSGIVRDIVAIQSPKSVQLTFKLAGKVAASEILRDDHSHDILLSLRTAEVIQKPTGQAGERPGDAPIRPTEAKTAEPPPLKLTDTPPEKTTDDPPETLAHKPPEPVASRKSNTPAPLDLADRKKRWELDVIVLDPGHGGRDPGSIGVTGVKEKEITLGIALKLGRLIQQQMKDVRVVYTRSDDTFVPLYRRGQIANEAGGKLFISIHANNLKRKPSPTRGFEVYLLRPGRTEEAVAIAEQENAVITLEEGYENRYQELTDENFILVTMAQSAHMKSSEVLADLVQKEMETMTGLPNRGVRQAGFYVLVGAAMPNILVETAFLSNRSDEKYLKSATGQRKIAEALFRAIKRYKAEYEKLLTGH